jgi:hypothetical protein
MVNQPNSAAITAAKGWGSLPCEGRKSLDFFMEQL